MVKLNTPRLAIVPLSVEQLLLFIENKTEELGKQLDVTAKWQIQPELRQIFCRLYPEILKNPDNYLWYSHWQIILPTEKAMVGGFLFKGIPDSQGMVEIGYGIDEPYRNRGYMTETLKTMVSWALTQGNVRSVSAKTEMGNEASQKVLEKAGFAPVGREESLYCYAIAKKPR